MEREVYTTAEVAEKMGVRPAKVIALAHAGKLPVMPRLGHDHYRFPKTTIDKLLVEGVPRSIFVPPTRPKRGSLDAEALAAIRNAPQVFR